MDNERHIPVGAWFGEPPTLDRLGEAIYAIEFAAEDKGLDAHVIELWAAWLETYRA